MVIYYNCLMVIHYFRCDSVTYPFTHCHSCLVTTNNGLKRHQRVSFEPVVCIFFFYARFQYSN